jgi:hypothetical protein
MTRAIRFTQASLRRAIEAARKAGLRVKGITADGTLLLEEANNPQVAENAVELEHKVVL